MRSSFLVQCLALAAFLTTSVAESIVPRKNSKVPRGFVTTNGREFELDGKPFVSIFPRNRFYSFGLTKFMPQAFVGANSYVCVCVQLLDHIPTNALLVAATPDFPR